METQLKGRVLPFKARNGSGSSGAPAAIVLPAVVAKPPAAKRSKGTRKPRLTDEQRFWAKVEKAGPHDCWHWTGSTNSGNGYGQFHTHRDGKAKMHTAHRFSYTLAFGPPPGSMNVLHTCGHRSCANPTHLYVGTQIQNMADAKRHGARRKRLTDDEVMKIRSLRGTLNGTQTAAAFGVCVPTIKKIWAGTTHKKTLGATARGERINQLDAGAVA